MKHPFLTLDPEIMGGTLCFTGTRVPVKALFDYLSSGAGLAEFLEDFPSVTRATRVLTWAQVPGIRIAIDAIPARL